MSAVAQVAVELLEELSLSADTMERLQYMFSGAPSGVIKLNVGGQIFVTSLETLTVDKNSSFCKILEKPVKLDDAVFIDRDGTHFRHILNFLRSGVLNIKSDITLHNELLVEADYYQIQGLKDLLQVTLPKISGNEDKDEVQKWKEKAGRLEKDMQVLQEEVRRLNSGM